MNSALRRKSRIVVLASGRGTNFQAIIDASESGRLSGEVVGLVSDNPNAAALERARCHGIPHVVVERKSYPSEACQDRVNRRLNRPAHRTWQLK
jgi:phosphoribosylglycinamide formyltransferase-1